MNSYLVMKERHKLNSNIFLHRTFNQNVMVQLFHSARKQLPIGDLSAATCLEEYNYTMLWPCDPPSFHNPLPQVAEGEVKDDPLFFPGHIKGELLDPRACFLCKKQGRYRLGSVRKDAQRRDQHYKLYTKSKFGCRTCNVALYNKNNCWVNYHRSDLTGQGDDIESINWFKS